MSTIVISDTDLANADTFLTAYLSSKITGADFSEGSVVRDFCVKAIAYVFAYLQQEKQYILDRQSLLSLSKLAGTDVDDAVDALLSNWFITRNQGRNATVSVTLHFSNQADITVSPVTKFFRTSSQIFTANALSSFVIPASQLAANVNSDGTVLDYTASVSMIATVAGAAGNIDPGRFIGNDAFNPFFLYAENQTKGQDGLDVETTADLLVRAPTAITVRNLVNARSIQTLLQQNFAGLSQVLTLGFGDPEMQRDLADEAVTFLDIHTGGFADIYLNLTRTDITETLNVSGIFERPDQLINVLRDTHVNFITAGVQRGDVIKVSSGIPNTPRFFIVTSVSAHELQVQSRTPFPVATDETNTNISYTVGNLSPSFDNTLGVGSVLTTGQTSRKVATPDGVLLTGRPHYKIKRVELLTTPSQVLSPRVNGTPAQGQYQLVNTNPNAAQSAYAMDTLYIYNPAGVYDGVPLKITYETLVGYDDIEAFVTDRFERVVTANSLTRGYNPVYISASVLYKRKNSSTNTVDPVAVSKAVATFISTFDSTDVIDASAVSQYIRDTFPDIGVVVSPFSLVYSLYAPDGQIYTFTTTDVVTKNPDYPNNNARLTNGLQLRTPIPNADLDPATNPGLVTAANVLLSNQLNNLGVSDRVLRYMANPEDITVTELAS